MTKKIQPTICTRRQKRQAEPVVGCRLLASLKLRRSGSVVGCQSGQALILVVMLIGGIFMVMTAVAGLLTFYQLQEAGGAGRSTEAVLAADAGLERTLRYYYTSEDAILDVCFHPNPPCRVVEGSLPNGATYEGFMRLQNGVPLPSDVTGAISATGRDRTGQAVRTLQMTFVRRGP